MEQPPTLRTLLDLSTPELIEVTPAHAQLTSLMMLAAEDQPGKARSAASAFELLGPDKDKMPLPTYAMLQRLGQYAPATMVSPVTLGVCSAMCSTPGRAVLWAHAIAASFARTGQPVTLRQVMRDHLDGWLPAEAGYAALWAEQKCGAANWLDHHAAWTQQALKAGAVERVPVADESG